MLKVVKEISARCDCLKKELKEARHETQLCSEKVEDGLNGVSSEINAINKDIEAQDTKTEKFYTKVDEMSKDISTQDLKIDKKYGKMSAEIEAKFSDKIEKQVQKAVKLATVEFEVKLSNVADYMKNITKENENINKAQHETTIEKQIEQLTSAFVQDKQWTDIVRKQVEDKVENKISEVTADVVILQQKTKAIQEDREGHEEISKRKTSFIIHGLDDMVEKYPTMNDSAGIIDLLHQIKCDDVSVNSYFRLGKPQIDSQRKPRPIKVIVSSESQKDKVLKSSKNLKGLSHKMAKVFIHQDQTPCQRAKRSVSF